MFHIQIRNSKFNTSINQSWFIMRLFIVMCYYGISPSIIACSIHRTNHTTYCTRSRSTNGKFIFRIIFLYYYYLFPREVEIKILRIEDVITGMLSSTAQAAELVQYYRHQQQQQEQAEQPRKSMIILVFPL
jgi:hypothetical protein